MIRKIINIFDAIERFFYYGMAGVKCVDFDADSVDHLVYAHMKRVQKFMKGPNTHLMWNSPERHKKGLMRKLDEFVELCRRKRNGKLNRYHYYTQFRKKYLPEDHFLEPIENPKLRKKLRIALNKDRAIEKSQYNRYYEMYRKYLPGFWD